jgi:DedD protein
LAALAILLCGCATTGGGETARPGTAAATDLPDLAATVAAQLEAAAQNDNGRLALVELELRRISDSLPRVSAPALAAAPGAIPQVAVSPQETAGPEGYAPAPELPAGRSLFSALTLGAYPNPDTARAAWFGMNAAHGEALAGLDARIETTVREDGGSAYILKAGPFASAAEAETLCGRLREAGGVCTAGDFTGENL